MNVTDAQRAREVLEALNDGDINTALKITRLQYYRRGQEKMRERCAQEAEQRFAASGWDSNIRNAGITIADCVRTLPITGGDDAG